MRALVTGATGGIGAATCRALVAAARSRGEVARLAVAASRPCEALDALVASLRAEGADVTGFAADLGEPDACLGLSKASAEACGGLDVLVSNAGIVRPAPLARLSLAEWEAVFAVDVRATWLLARGAYDALRASRGALVAVASVSAHFPFPGLGAYSPAKAALAMLCRQLALEWAGEGIRVNSVSPGLVRTPLTEPLYRDDDLRRRREQVVPLGRIGTPEDVARAIAHLAGPDAGYVTGVDLRLDGGLADAVLRAVPGRPGGHAE